MPKCELFTYNSIAFLSSQNIKFQPSQWWLSTRGMLASPQEAYFFFSYPNEETKDLLYDWPSLNFSYRQTK